MKKRDLNLLSFSINLELEGEKRISGNNLFNLLDHIERHGSISHAATILGFSYRYAWGLIREAENALGVKLVIKQVGGHSGGGASLTRESKQLLAQYKNFKEEIDSQLHLFVNSKDLTYQKEPSKISSTSTDNAAGRHLLLASTMEPVEAGLLDLLEQAFYQHSGILVRHIALGSGRALDIAREGRVDMTLTHAPDLEEQFIREGWGSRKIALMENDFVVAGPASNPEGVDLLESTGPGVINLFKQISVMQAPFISRGDQSGTHLKEQQIWKAAGINPGGLWYLVSPGVAGNLGILSLAAEKRAYTLVDRASFMLAEESSQQLRVVYSGTTAEDRALLNNIFNLILVNPLCNPDINHQGAVHFARWLQQEGQEIMLRFGTNRFGKPLFTLYHEGNS